MPDPAQPDPKAVAAQSTPVVPPQTVPPGLNLPPAPTGVMALVREWTTTGLAVLIAIPVLYMMVTVFSKSDLAGMKEVMGYGLGLFGTVLGFYFGRVPAERRAEAAETKAGAAQELARQTTAQAAQAHQQVADGSREREATAVKLAEAKAGVMRATSLLGGSVEANAKVSSPLKTAAPITPREDSAVDSARNAALLELEVLARSL